MVVVRDARVGWVRRERVVRGIGEMDTNSGWGLAALQSSEDVALLFVELAKYSEYPKRGIEVCEQRLRGGQLFGRGTRPIR